MELKSEGEKSGHHPSNDPLEDLLVASENGDRKGVDQGKSAPPNPSGDLITACRITLTYCIR